ncbi:hypothetical protein HPB52_024145 [Rhipicephalus sanguineus]|uniref:BPTI/Kunitz inhibitor domain-containing protein n=1 Tax=Rhipicephalus sanguineus TaxID=34632 RepID=A0A9D4T4J7_RHISA|nr:hypothetical protein HPB52_024145 [Rhipicephalus sanguineus]
MERLLQLGLHHMATEIFEAHRNAQISRLSHSRAGTEILLEAGIHPFMPPEKSQLGINAKNPITVYASLETCTRQTTKDGKKRDRRQYSMRSHATKRQFSSLTRPHIGMEGAYAVSAVDDHGSLVNGATVITNFTHEAEEWPSRWPFEPAREPPGPCEQAITRFYFDPEEKSCRRFRYSGCRSNLNNFRTEKACMEACAPPKLPPRKPY